MKTVWGKKKIQTMFEHTTINIWVKLLDYLFVFFAQNAVWSFRSVFSNVHNLDNTVVHCGIFSTICLNMPINWQNSKYGMHLSRSHITEFKDK